MVPFRVLSPSLSHPGPQLDFDSNQNWGKGLGDGGTSSNAGSSFPAGPQREPWVHFMSMARLPTPGLSSASPGRFWAVVLELRGQLQRRLCLGDRASAILEKVVRPLPLPSSPFLEKGLPP